MRNLLIVIKIRTNQVALFLLFSFFYMSCGQNSKYSKSDHLYNYKIGEELYAEHFKVDSYGVGGDVYSLYLTDSSTFREFVTLNYDAENFDFGVHKNEIEILKFEEIGGLNGIERSKKVVRKFSFSKMQLVTKGKMD